MRKHIAIIIASLALFTGQAHAQRCLPKMQGIEARANLADGFKPGGNDGGYSFGRPNCDVFFPCLSFCRHKTTLHFLAYLFDKKAGRLYDENNDEYTKDDGI